LNKTRIEAFSDGVIAILITIMVLELKVPHGSDFAALLPLVPVVSTYVLSFVILGIYWNNHHHMFHTVDRVSGGIMWANLHLLFWLSLVPFVTGWMGENHFAAIPTAGYGIVLLGSALAYTILEKTIVAHQGPQSRLREAVGKDWKGTISALLYALAIPIAFVWHWASDIIYVGATLLWLVPDSRIEAKVK
jgi:uncharacterized membrane protein